ncbi:phosphotransferase family protein [Hydrogenophaga sp. BPS33]|uniref:phosphotransferase family protein n=1 Tax=Hydrogenophaga sp. BPS33 TaxID=2651974 RepID=UPI0013200F50|nr:phosphotransferase family protein [Hydrogenophaga sp. BPS33]QHE84844.1 phosphotransferase family protein [Hydrogenophaga sp. BPS33]
MTATQRTHDLSPMDTEQPDRVAQVVRGLKGLILNAIPSARDIDLQGLVRSAGGLSRENWSFDAKWHDAAGSHTHPLMLMRDAAGTLLNTERSREFAVLQALAQTNVPAPKVHWMDEQGCWLGTPSVVMERMPGACDYMVLNGAQPLEARLSLAQDFIRLMTDIQAVDWQALGLADSLGLPDVAPSLCELSHWEAEYRKSQLEPQPELDYVLAWLKRRAPQAEAIVLVHGDFKPGNALIHEGSISAKLDWETAHLGDPLEDLGWVTNPVRKREHQIPGHWERQQIVDAYRELTGRQVLEADLLWWNVFSCWKLSVIQLTAVAEFVAGRYNRVFQTPSWLFRPMLQMMEAAP